MLISLRSNFPALMIKRVILKSIVIGTVIGTTIGLVSQSAQAADSLWLLCDDGKLAVNLLEHRNGMDGNVQKRAITITLLLGSNIFVGELDTTSQDASNPRKVSLSSISTGDKSSFSGTITIDLDYSNPNQKKVLFLNGNLRLQSDLNRKLKINSQLQCKEMQSNL
jgi:hypothetical protein